MAVPHSTSPRPLGKFLTLFLAALTLALIALWIRSRRTEDCVACAWNDMQNLKRTALSVTSVDGQVQFACWELDYNATFRASSVAKRGMPETGLFYWRNDRPAAAPKGSFWQRLGFNALYRAKATSLNRYTEFALPHWLLVLLSAAIPIFRATHHIKRRRTPPPNQCLACGYDLRATPHRCPECGTDVPP